MAVTCFTRYWEPTRGSKPLKNGPIGGFRSVEDICTLVSTLNDAASANWPEGPRIKKPREGIRGAECVRDPVQPSD